jgi:hypothetical protein
MQANLPETSPFLSPQMYFLSSFFQVFQVLGVYNFGGRSQNVTFRMRKLKKGLLKAFLHQRGAITSGATQFHPRSSKKADN